ncbi:hypothetical protein HKBW3S09_01486, partial [Candidatus Hakubella thermalkaliphila]
LEGGKKGIVRERADTWSNPPTPETPLAMMKGLSR